MIERGTNQIVTKMLLWILSFSLSASSLFASQAGDSKWVLKTTSIDEVLGNANLKSENGSPIVIYSFKKGTKESSLKFYIQGGLHGNEVGASAFVVWLKNRLLTNNGGLAEFPEGTEIDFIPFVNPDSQGSSRYNVNNVNLNRNFSVLWGLSKEPNGEHPVSEKETMAITSLMAARKYHAAVDVHGYINWIVVPSVPEFVSNRKDQESLRYWQWISVINSNMNLLKQFKYEIKSAGKLGDGGAFEDWAFWQNNTLSFCLEVKDLSIESRPKGTQAFLEYENFIASTFMKSTQIPSGSQPVSTNIAKTILHDDKPKDMPQSPTEKITPSF